MEEMTMIETYLLENLVAFGDYGTLSEAAEKLHVSQPSLTRSMQKLEDEIGVPLFERTKNRISLNEFGLQAVSSARWILQEQDNMVRELQSRYRLSRTISLGCCAPVPSWDMQQTLSQLYSDLTISVEIRPEEILWRGLSEEIYQLIVVPVQTSIYQEDGIRFPELQGTPADPLGFSAGGPSPGPGKGTVLQRHRRTDHASIPFRGLLVSHLSGENAPLPLSDAG